MFVEQLHFQLNALKCQLISKRSSVVDLGAEAELKLAAN